MGRERAGCAYSWKDLYLFSIRFACILTWAYSIVVRPCESRTINLRPITTQCATIFKFVDWCRYFAFTFLIFNQLVFYFLGNIISNLTKYIRLYADSTLCHKYIRLYIRLSALSPYLISVGVLQHDIERQYNPNLLQCAFSTLGSRLCYPGCW